MEPPVNNRKVGRPKDSIWERVAVNGEIATCRECGDVIQWNGKLQLYRVRAHFDRHDHHKRQRLEFVPTTHPEPVHQATLAPQEQQSIENEEELPVMRKSGRQRHPVWLRVDVQGQIVTCKDCHEVIHRLGRTHVDRLHRHFDRKCRKVLQERAMAAMAQQQQQHAPLPPAMLAPVPSAASPVDGSASIATTVRHSTSPRRPGRSRHPVWARVTVVGQIVTCNECGSVVHRLGQTHVDRVRAHFEKRCLKLGMVFSPAVQAPSTSTSVVHTQPKSTNTATSGSAMARSQAKFAERLAHWMYMTGIPFHHMEHPSFKEAIAAIAPNGISVPSTERFATDLLDLNYQKSMRFITKQCDGKRTTLSVECVHQDDQLVMVYHVMATGASMFLEAIDTSVENESPEWIAEDIKRVLDTYASTLHISAVMTSHLELNQRMWTRLQPQYPQVFFYGCVLTTLRDIVHRLIASMPWLKEVVESCQHMIETIRNVQPLYQALDAAQQTALMLPEASLPESMVECLQAVWINRDSLLDVCSPLSGNGSHEDTEAEQVQSVYETLESAAFSEQLQRAVEVLGPLRDHMARLNQTTTPMPSLSAVYDCFLQLPKQMASTLSSTDVQLIHDRLEAVCLTPAHSMAYLLDPRCAGQAMDVAVRTTTEAAVCGWFRHENPEEAAAAAMELVKYYQFVQTLKDQSQRHVFYGLLVDERISPLEFWHTMSGFPLLQQLAFRVFAATAMQSNGCHQQLPFVKKQVDRHAGVTDERHQRLLHVMMNDYTKKKTKTTKTKEEEEKHMTVV